MGYNLLVTSTTMPSYTMSATRSESYSLHLDFVGGVTRTAASSNVSFSLDSPAQVLPYEIDDFFEQTYVWSAFGNVGSPVTLTPHTAYQGGVGSVALTLPVRPDAGGIATVGWLLAGDIAFDYSGSGGVNAVGAGQNTSVAIQATPSDTSHGVWRVADNAPLGMISSTPPPPSPFDGHISTYSNSVISLSGPDGFQPGQPISTYPVGITSAKVHYKDDKETSIDSYGYYFGEDYNISKSADGDNIVPWLEAGWNATSTINVQFTCAQIVPLIVQAAGLVQGQTLNYSCNMSSRCVFSNFRLILNIVFAKDLNQPSSAFGHMGLTTFKERNVTAAAWFTKENPPVTGKKQLMVGVHRGILGSMGTGTGSTSGWETYPYGDVDAGSDLGLEYFPNSNLYMSLDRYVGDPTIQSNAHPKYTINQVMGAGPINNQRTWADEQDIAGTKSEIIQGGYGDHAQKFPFKIRTGP